MSNKVRIKNPKDQNYEDHQSKVYNLLETQAKRLFEHKSFNEEFKAVYYLTALLKVVSNLVSFLTAFVAVQLATKLVFGQFMSAFLAVVVCLSLEVVKFYLWRINSKWVLRYKRTSKGIFGVLLLLHLLSLGLSAYGGWVLPTLIEQKTAPKIASINIESISAPFTAAIAKIDDLTAKNAQKIATTNSNSTTRSLTEVSKTLLDQRNEQERLKNGAISEAKQKHKEKQAAAAKEDEKRQKKHLESIFIARVSCMVASVFFELLFIVCSCFGVFYLYKLHVELEQTTTAETTAEPLPSKRQTDFAETLTEQPINTAVQPSKRQAENIEGQPSNPIGFRQSNLDLKVCRFSGCHQTFENAVHNKKYCSDECKKMAYQERRYQKNQTN